MTRDQLGEDLRRLADGAPTVTDWPVLVRETARVQRRNMAVLGVAGAVLAAVVGVSVVTTVLSDSSKPVGFTGSVNSPDPLPSPSVSPSTPAAVVPVPGRGKPASTPTAPATRPDVAVRILPGETVTTNTDVQLEWDKNGEDWAICDEDPQPNGDACRDGWEFESLSTGDGASWPEFCSGSGCIDQSVSDTENPKGWHSYPTERGGAGVHHWYETAGTYTVSWHFRHTNCTGMECVTDAEHTVRLTITVVGPDDTTEPSPAPTDAPTETPSSAPS